jgi:hypothetical protein|tara:strand:- start:3189 stop:3464 length:276 start_codon:yes stop_codon:yes gene_type:complete
MVIMTKHGEFECKDITRKERRELYGKVKVVFQDMKPELVHELADDFALIAFETEEKAGEVLGSLTVLEEDEVLMEIINSYMGFETPSGHGD